MSEAWKQAWQSVVERVGTDYGDGTVHWGADLVEQGAIRRFLEPLEFDCALHYSATAARAHGYPDIVAPYTSTPTFAMVPLWSPGTIAFPSAERNAQPLRLAINPDEFPPEATGLFATDFEATFIRPATVGDRLGGTGRKLVDVTLKETRVGRGAFLKYESEIVDQNHQTVALNRSGLFVYVPRENGATSPPALPPRPVPAEWTAGPPAANVNRQRLAKDVQLGEVIDAIDFPLPVFRLVMEAGANRDFNLIHHNTEFARANGAPEMYANTLFLQAMWERFARDYIGEGGTIQKIEGFRMVSFNMAGDVVRVRGTVEDVSADDQIACVRIKVWSENSAGISVGPGFITAGLPVRED